IVLALGVVSARPFMDQVGVLVIVAVLITVGVYGLVAGIVKLDDLGLYLKKTASSAAQKIGGALLWLAPVLMKVLSIVGTAAMFMVGGGILVHGLPFAHHWAEGVTEAAAGAVGGLSMVVPTLIDAVAGVIAGAVLVLVVTLIGKVWKAARE
ncbi:DUF808 family protein, partial [Pseudomonas savastanoi]